MKRIKSIETVFNELTRSRLLSVVAEGGQKSCKQNTCAAGKNFGNAFSREEIHCHIKYDASEPRDPKLPFVYPNAPWSRLRMESLDQYQCKGHSSQIPVGVEVRRHKQKIQHSSPALICHMIPDMHGHETQCKSYEHIEVSDPKHQKGNLRDNSECDKSKEIFLYIFCVVAALDHAVDHNRTRHAPHAQKDPVEKYGSRKGQMQGLKYLCVSLYTRCQNDQGYMVQQHGHKCQKFDCCFIHKSLSGIGGFLSSGSEAVQTFHKT